MNRRVIGILLAFVLAVIGTGAVLFYVKLAQDRVSDGQKAVRVLVAAERIPAGTSGERIRSGELVEELIMPASTVPADALSTITTELDDLVVTSELQPRQLLLRGQFGAATKISGGLAVPEKMIAVSVKLEVEEEVGGFIRPGSQIAVFGTYEVMDKAYKDVAGENNKHTRLLLPRTEVLAVGAYGEDGVTTGDASREQDPRKQGEVTLIVTVSVNQKDAERLIHSARIGELYAALLNESSEVSPDSGGVDNRTLLN
jgi:pilus assembly protein CpaB